MLLHPIQNQPLLKDNDHPRLPPELERVIFEIAALSYPTTTPNLMLIAWRVKNWYVTLTIVCVFT